MLTTPWGEEKCPKYKDQPQHPVFPLQLRHLQQNAQSFLGKSSEENLFEENKIPSDPVPIVQLPAAKHGAHARLMVKYISKSWMYNYDTYILIRTSLSIKYVVNLLFQVDWEEGAPSDQVNDPERVVVRVEGCDPG